MISGLLPEGVCAVETLESCAGACLLPEEAAAIGTVSARRLNEFTLARTCARHAMAHLGIAPTPILVGAHREPVWPPQLVGSITHCPGYCAAAVALSSRLRTIGIDAELHDELPRDVLEQIVLEEERQLLGALGKGEIHWDRVLFSAKECVYKAWYPLTHRWLGFKDATISLHPDNGTFRARLLVTPPLPGDDRPTVLDGRYRIDDGLVLTAVWRETTNSADLNPV